MRKKPARVCIIDAPCKINLHLAVGERRPDGFHELQSLFAPLAFHDTLRFECGGKDLECSLEMNWETPTEVIPPEKNLVSRAVSLFRERTGFKSGLFVRLDKRIPAGAGLGGGSSDAASCLLALNSLAGDALSVETLRELAAVLGSDVPFFLNRGTDDICPSDRNVCPPADTIHPSAAFVGGRGELVRPVKTPQGLWVLLVKPDFSSDTSGAFQLLDQIRKSLPREGKMSLLAGEKPPADVLIKALEGAPETWPFYNDFLPVFLNSHNLQELTTEFHGEEFYHEPHEQEKKTTEGTEGKTRRVKEAEKYREILAALKEEGASFVGLSGAGSCCFGVFKAKETAEKAGKRLGFSGNFVKLTFFLAKKTIPVLE
jgi:4-diphosphocytidyl-2-C-methyl-D-erythritol kinase